MLLDVPLGIGERILVFDQEPGLPLALLLRLPQLHEHETASQLLAVQDKLQLSALQSLGRGQVTLGLEGPVVPHAHRSRAVVALRDHSFEAGIVQRMVFGLHGQAFVGRVQRRALGHGPGLERSVDLEAEVVVQAPGVVLLHDETVSASGDRASFSRRLGGLVEPSFVAILFEGGHGSIGFVSRLPFV